MRLPVSAWLAIGALALLALAIVVGDRPAPRPASSASGNPAHDLLVSMSESRRSERLADYMRANGARCPAVTRSLYQGSTPAREAMWNVRCSPGEDWSLMIEPDAGGSVTVTECASLRLVGVNCWRRFTS